MTCSVLRNYPTKFAVHFQKLKLWMVFKCFTPLNFFVHLCGKIEIDKDAQPEI